MQDEDLIDNLIFKIEDSYSDSDIERIKNAWHFLLEKTSEKKRLCGNPYYIHPLRVAEILAEKKLGADTVIAGLFHNIYEVTDDQCLEEISEKFGTDIASICRGTSKITGMKINTTSIQQADSIRKMLFAMVDDIRVILVKLADRLDRMRNLKFVSEQAQKAVAKEVIDIWSPLASRLGMSDVKSEMEDLSLKYSNPDAFQYIKTIVAQKKQERAEYLNNAVKKIYTATEKAGISVNITSRAKHFYSIYQKMKKRNKEPGELYDLLALRIICKDTSDCYVLVGLVHGLWKPMEGRFKDYIAMPKANGYQSLHTTVICEGKPLEIQIRTEEMHKIAEHGVASHWLYKKGTNHDLVKAEDLSIINQLRALRDENLSDEKFFAELKNELLGDSIYVFTPKGDVKELPAGSCAIDFAYAIHSSIGEKIVGAKADGKIIPLTAPLKNTQIIDILTNPQAHPTQSQLKAVKTSRARQRIHSWLVENDPTFIDREAEAKREEQIAANSIYSKRIAEETREQRRKNALAKKEKLSDYSGKVRVDNVTNYSVIMAGCCKPNPGDPIVGYISHKRGIMIHRADCRTYLRIQNVEARSVSVEWDLSVSSKEKKKDLEKKQEMEKARKGKIDKNKYSRQR